jgi:thioredoxin-related protein
MLRILNILLHPVTITATIIVLYFAGAARAAPDMSLPHTANVELVVIEAEGCRYCEVFRRDVWPAYVASPRAHEAPMRFLDINDEAAEHLRLAAPVTMVPTVVVIRDGAEVGRIAGYVGPESFFVTVKSLIPAGTD